MTDPTPIVPSHVCASCKAPISTLDGYQGHTDKCMQPEIRMRRLEAHVAELSARVQALGHRAMSCPFCRVINPAIAPDGVHFINCEFSALVQRVKVLEHEQRLMHESLTLLAALTVPKESHGKPQDPGPDTKRSGTLIDARSFGIPGGPGRVKWLACNLHFPGRQPGCEACDSGFTHPDASPTEPPGEAPVGAPGMV